MSEGMVVKACIEWLCLHGCDIIRNNTGAFKKSYRRNDGSTAEYHVRVGKKGSGDILACSPYGRWIEVEAKFGKNGQQPEQVLRQQQIESRGGVYIVARSIDDLETRKADILRKAFG